MKYSLRSLMIVVGVATVLSGCENDARRPNKLEQIRKGIENVDKHAKEIEAASQPKPVEPAP